MRKKQVNYGNGLRGCFLTVIKWPILIIAWGTLCYVMYAKLLALYPNADEDVLGAVAGLGSGFLIEITAYCLGTFMAHATAEDEGGLVSLDRGLRRRGDGKN